MVLMNKYKMIKEVIGLYSEELQLANQNSVQLTIHGMQAKIEKQKRLLEEQKQEIEELEDILSNSTKKNQYLKEKSEDYQDALDFVYKIMSSLEKYMPEEVLFYAAPILADLMNSKDVAIYTVVNRNYARLFSSTSPSARELGNSIKYTSLEDMYQCLNGGQIYINREQKSGLPSMSGAVYSEDEIHLILMFWNLPKQQLNRIEANRLTVIITLLQNAFLRAKRYMSSFRRQHYIEGTNVLNEDAFTHLVNTFLDARSKGLTKCTLAEVVMGYQNYDRVAIQLAGNIRHTDYMGIMENEKLYILLTNTDMAQAKAVQERLHKAGYQSILKETPE